MIAGRLGAVFVFGLLVLLSPVTGAFNRTGSLFGLPCFPLYLFVSWAAVVVAAWYLTRGGRR
jgi:hypothetical protein